jgi:hypothetical protein
VTLIERCVSVVETLASDRIGKSLQDAKGLRQRQHKHQYMVAVEPHSARPWFNCGADALNSMYVCVRLWLSRGTGKRSAICGGSALPVSVVNDAISESVLTAVTWCP